MDIEEYNFLKDKLDYISKKSFEFQSKCDEKIKGKNNVILSMPTGSGKTDRFLAWAINALIYENISIPKIIITSPIKALSNQRFRELYLSGYNVGLETGDVNYNVDNCTFLCCTQEIATNKYIYEDIITIIDEFHYIYNDSSRARTYIDYIINSKSNHLFLCSATLGDINKIINYLERISKRNFFGYKSEDMLTNIIIKSSIKLEDIKNAYVVSFRHESCIKNANRIRHNRMNKYIINESSRQKILKTASKYKIEDASLVFNALYGVSYYYGSMLPKERLFVTELLQNRLIDTVCGTDAISLGVNFPIEKVVFTTLRKRNSVIGKNLFNQIIGRAGRYGLYANGYIYYSLDLKKDINLASDFENIIASNEEDATITLMPSIKNIISNKNTIEEEIKYVQDNATDIINYEKLLEYIKDALKVIMNFNIEESLAQFYFNNIIAPRKYKKINWEELPTEKVESFISNYKGYNLYQEEFQEQIIKLYDDEFLPIENCILLRDIICDFDLDVILKNSTRCLDGNYKEKFRKLLQVRKYLNKLPNKYKNRIDLDRLDSIISTIDASVFDIKLSFQEYSKFAIYNSQELSEKVQNIPKINKSTNNKKIDKPLNNKPFLEGTIIKETGESIGALKYVVLLYKDNECLLLNYNSYLCGFISLTMQSTLKNYSQIDMLSESKYKEVILKCKANSASFISSENSTKKKLTKIKKILK